MHQTIISTIFTWVKSTIIWTSYRGADRIKSFNVQSSCVWHFQSCSPVWQSLARFCVSYLCVWNIFIWSSSITAFAVAKREHGNYMTKQQRLFLVGVNDGEKKVHTGGNAGKALESNFCGMGVIHNHCVKRCLWYFFNSFQSDKDISSLGLKVNWHKWSNHAQSNLWQFL